MAHKGIRLGSRIVKKRRPKSIENQTGETALWPRTAGKPSNPASDKIFLYGCVFLWALKTINKIIADDKTASMIFARAAFGLSGL